jgi:hypothetical protein
MADVEISLATVDTDATRGLDQAAASLTKLEATAAGTGAAMRLSASDFAKLGQSAQQQVAALNGLDVAGQKVAKATTLNQSAQDRFTASLQKGVPILTGVAAAHTRLEASHASIERSASRTIRAMGVMSSVIGGQVGPLGRLAEGALMMTSAYTALESAALRAGTAVAFSASAVALLAAPFVIAGAVVLGLARQQIAAQESAVTLSSAEDAVNQALKTRQYLQDQVTKSVRAGVISDEQAIEARKKILALGDPRVIQQPLGVLQKVAGGALHGDFQAFGEATAADTSRLLDARKAMIDDRKDTEKIALDTAKAQDDRLKTLLSSRLELAKTENNAELQLLANRLSNAESDARLIDQQGRNTVLGDKANFDQRIGFAEAYFARKRTIIDEEAAAEKAAVELTNAALKVQIEQVGVRLAELQASIRPDIEKIRQMQAEIEAMEAKLTAGVNQVKTITARQAGQQQGVTQDSLTFRRNTQAEADAKSAFGPGGGMDQWRKGFIGMQDAAATTAKLLEATLQPAIEGISRGITGLVLGTMTWRQAAMQAGQAIVGSLVDIGVKMIANMVLGQALHAAAKIEAATTGTSIFASYAPASVAAGASTMGIGPTIGIAITIAALVAGIAMAMGAFAEGGLIPGTPSHSDNRLAMVASGEFVIPTRIVQAWGPEHFEAYRRGEIPGLSRHSPRVNYGSSFSDGGMVAMSAGRQAVERSTRTHVAVGMINSRQEYRDFTAKSGWKVVADASAKRGNKVIY